MTNESQKKILKRIETIHKKSESTKEKNLGLRKELAEAIREAKDAGVPYREIGEVLGIGKTGISQILSRGEQ